MPEYFKHETAIVDEDAKIGKNTKIWHFSHVMSKAIIGEKCTLGQNVFVQDNAKIGNNVKIQNNVSVYRGVTLEDNVFCGPSMVFTNVKVPKSAFPTNDSEYLNTLVKRGVSIGANATIVCGIVIGKHAFIGAGTVVTKDVPDYAIIIGVPGKLFGWMCECGAKLSNTLACTNCDRKYEMDRKKLKEIK